MPNDVITLKAITKELNFFISGGRIEKIYQPETDEITLNIKVGRKPNILVISANPTQPRIHITTQRKENLYTAPSFCMLLRKYLTGSFIENIEIFNSDRIVKISIISKTELKDIKKFFLMVELMGRYSNIILTDENMIIIDAIRRIHFDQSTTRYILPNLKYIIQPKTRIGLDETELLKNFFATNPNSDAGSIIKNISGVSKETANEIALSINPYEKLIELYNINNQSTFSPCLRYEKDILSDYYVQPYLTIKGDYHSFLTMNEALDIFYLHYDGRERKKASTKTLTTLLKRLQTKTERRINDNLSKLSEIDKAEELRKNGELILSYLYKIKPHDKELECLDYYTGQIIKIDLNDQLSPSENAQLFFKKYAKLKRAFPIAKEQLSVLYEQRSYLESIALSIENCSLKSEYDEILNELNSISGYNSSKKRIYSKEKPSAPIKLTIDGFDVYLGKNNLQNNQVTFSIGNGGDTWLHAKAHHGAHMIIKGTPTNEVIIKCASIVAFYSGASKSEKVEVDYTLRKYVKKIPSAMPGMVTYTNYHSVLVAPINYTEI